MLEALDVHPVVKLAFLSKAALGPLIWILPELLLGQQKHGCGRRGMESSFQACLLVLLSHVWGVGVNARYLEQEKVENLGAFFFIWPLSRLGRRMKVLWVKMQGNLEPLEPLDRDQSLGTESGIGPQVILQLPTG